MAETWYMEYDLPLPPPMTLGVSNWRWTLSWRVFVRPVKKKRAAAKARMTGFCACWESALV